MPPTDRRESQFRIAGLKGQPPYQCRPLCGGDIAAIPIYRSDDSGAAAAPEDFDIPSLLSGPRMRLIAVRLR